MRSISTLNPRLSPLLLRPQRTYSPLSSISVFHATSNHLICLSIYLLHVILLFLFEGEKQNHNEPIAITVKLRILITLPATTCQSKSQSIISITLSSDTLGITDSLEFNP